MKELKLIKKYMILNFQRELAYKSDFIGSMFAIISYLAAFILAQEFIFASRTEILGISKHEMFIMLLLGQLWWFLNVTFVRKSMQQIAKNIFEGSLDFLLLKPFKLSLIKPFIAFDVRHIPVAIVILFILIYQSILNGLNIFQIGLMLFYICLGVVIAYAYTAIWVNLTFWFGRNDSIPALMIELPELIKLPGNFYNGVMQIVFSTFIPIIMIADPVRQIITNKIDLGLLIYTLLYTIIILAISEFLWTRGLKSYSSAN